MGFLDNVTSAVNRGTASAGRATEKIKLNARISELNKQRQRLAAQLGALLYEVTKDDPNHPAESEALYAAIARCDEEREACQTQIHQLEQQSAAVATASSTFKCAVCGATMSGSDLFCSGCGSPVEKARPQVASNAPVAVEASAFCANCGAPMAADDLFCMSCGTKVGAAPELKEANASADAATTAPADTPATTSANAPETAVATDDKKGSE